ncbi:Hypothetical protein CFV354_0129 [Campylobacter fetus subsp. venerealis NCTC 10354]|nr:Hypothetical protein CFV354_0129 [Campylobacter fetus subsp. venerealis NCTC 10354]
MKRYNASFPNWILDAKYTISSTWAI